MDLVIEGFETMVINIFSKIIENAFLQSDKEALNYIVNIMNSMI